MLAAEKPSKEWEIKRVLDELRAQARERGVVTAQVFLHDTFLHDAAGDLAQAARNLLAAAGASTDKASIGRVSNLAKSFSLTASPDVFAALARLPAVKAILPSQIDDVYPKPTRIVRE
jgi:hypothetical protein